MAISPSLQPSLDPAHLPKQALYGDNQAVGWELSREPFTLSAGQLADIRRLGPVLVRLAQVGELLYRDSVKGRQPEWVSVLFDQGKPDELVRFSRMNRFKKHAPMVIRPDLLITEDGWALCEIDSVPGGIGFTSALNQAYRQSGFAVVETPNTMPMDFLAMLQSAVPEIENPVIAIILSDESEDYRPEMTWVVQLVQEKYPHLHMVHPSQVDLVRDRLVLTTEAGEEKKIDLIYRFFELFDLPNIPKMELIQYAVKKGLVQCTPPFKPLHEEKLLLALLHHPSLKAFWVANLGTDDFAWLLNLVPQGWILDPARLPPQAVIPNLTPGGRAVQAFEELASLSQKERELVIKPSGFSPLAWGSRGVTVGHDVSGDVWQERLFQALAAFGTTPHLLQQFKNTAVTQVERLPKAGEASGVKVRMRTRLCPYFFVQEDVPELVGILATSCPIDKKIIHGMKDAILAPCQPAI